MNELANWTSQPPLEDDGVEVSISCDACAESVCAVCEHEPCSICLNDCDHSECLAASEDGKNTLKKNHVCSFTPCEQHRVKQ